MKKFNKILFTMIATCSIFSVNADSSIATISNTSIGPSFRSSGAMLMPTNSWLSPITIPSSPISSPIGSSSTSLGISFGEISAGTVSLSPDIASPIFPASIAIPTSPAIAIPFLNPNIKKQIIDALMPIFNQIKIK